MDKATAPDWGTIGMTVEEAADTLRVERRSVLDAIAERGLPAVRIGRGWRIDPDALKAWIARGQQEEQADEAYEVRCRFYCDHEKDTLTLELGSWGGEVGGALDVEMDKDYWSQGKLTFKDENGSTTHATLGVDEEGRMTFAASDLSLAELGEEAAKLGYRVEPGMEPFVGCYIAEKLEEAVGMVLAEHACRTRDK